MNTDYEILDVLFQDVPMTSEDIIVDVGCGKGRVLNWLLFKGKAKRIVGIENNPSIAEFARKRLQYYASVRIIMGNAEEVLPDEGTIFYLFNPFNEEILTKLERRLSEMAQHHKVTVIYYAALYLDVFRRNTIWDIKFLDLDPLGHKRSAIVSSRPV